MATTPVRSSSPTQQPVAGYEVDDRATSQPRMAVTEPAPAQAATPSILRPRRHNLTPAQLQLRQQTAAMSSPHTRRIQINEAANETVLIPCRRQMAAEVVTEAISAASTTLTVTASTQITRGAPFAAFETSRRATLAAEAASVASIAAAQAVTLAPKVAEAAAHTAIAASQAATAAAHAVESHPNASRTSALAAIDAATVARSAAQRAARAAAREVQRAPEVDRVATPAALAASSAARAAMLASIAASQFSLETSRTMDHTPRVPPRSTD